MTTAKEKNQTGQGTSPSPPTSQNQNCQTTTSEKPKYEPPPRPPAQRWADSDIPLRYRGWTLDDYPAETGREVRDWLNDKQSWSLYISGVLGTRKTSLAAAILKLWRSHFPAGYDGRLAGWFLPIDKAVPWLRDPDERPWLMTKCEQTRLLVLDDIGSSRSTAHVVEQLGFVLRHRYDNKKRTIITSNLSIKDFGRSVDSRLADRLREGKQILGGKESKR